MGWLRTLPSSTQAARVTQNRHNLVETCLRNGAVRGYQTAFAEATNPVSQHIFGQHGFEARVSRLYGDYRLGDAAVFTSIAHQGGPKLMDRTIGEPTQFSTPSRSQVPENRRNV